MSRKYNTRLIKAKRSYSPKDMAVLFGINKATCLRWIKNEGLNVLQENTSPLLIMGKDLKKFLSERNKKRKTNLKENEYFCMKCKKAVKAKIGSEENISTGKTIGKDKRKQLNKIGFCEFCGTKLNKFLRVSQTY